MIKYVYDNFLKINMVLSLAYIIHKKIKIMWKRNLEIFIKKEG